MRLSSECFPQIHMPLCHRPGILIYPKGRGSRPVFHKKLLVENGIVRGLVELVGNAVAKGETVQESRGAPVVVAPHGETKRVGFAFHATGAGTVPVTDERFPQINRLHSRCPRYLNIARGNGRARFSTRNLLWKTGSARGPVELVGNAVVEREAAQRPEGASERDVQGCVAVPEGDERECANLEQPGRPATRDDSPNKGR